MKTQPIDTLTAAIVTILQHPQTPGALYEAVSAFICNATNLRNSSDETLLGRWTESPECIAACIAWTKETEDLESMAAETIKRKAGGAQ